MNLLRAYLGDKQKDIYDFCNLIDVHKSAHTADTGHHNTKQFNENVLNGIHLLIMGIV